MKKYFLFFAFTLISFFGCSDVKQESAVKTDSLLPAFVFVAKYEGLPAVYKYLPEKDSSEVVWFSRNEKVIELITPDNSTTSFFLTAKSAGKNGLMPFINGLKLYSLDENNNASFLKDFGNVLMVVASITSESTLKIITNKIDETGVIYVDQNEKIFNEFGKVMSDKTTRFHLAKQGFPITPVRQITLTSNNINFSASLSDSTRKILDLKYGKNKIFKFSSNQELNAVKWIVEDSLTIISTVDISPSNSTLDSKNPETSTLNIFSYKDKKIVKEWKGSGLKNCRIIGSFLIFDNNFGSDSEITVFDTKTLKERKVIKHKGGCGIKHIPAKPDYDA